MLNISQTKNFQYDTVAEIRLAKGNENDLAYCRDQNPQYVYIPVFAGGTVAVPWSMGCYNKP